MTIGANDGSIQIGGGEAASIANDQKISYYNFDAVLDQKDRIWLADEDANGLRYDISTKRVERFRIPTTGRVFGGLHVDGDTLWFRGDTGVATWKVGAGAITRVFPVDAGSYPDGYVLTPGTVWITTSKLSDSNRKLDCATVAIDRASGKVVANAHDPVATGVPAWWPMTLLLEGDSALWVTRPGTGTVERMDRNGHRRVWSFAPKAPVDLLLTAPGALLLVRKAQITVVYEFNRDLDERKILETDLVVIDGLTASLKSVRVPDDLREASLRRDASGQFRLGAAGVVSLKGGLPSIEREPAKK
ncbi:MAG: hypothetical protein HY815_30280 [Candidatus Riflebacteria bacterium]|nr:hypothetical protein [Candidatus Riflebacteria bacterium]